MVKQGGVNNLSAAQGGLGWVTAPGARGRDEAANERGDQRVNTCPTSLNMLSGERKTHFTSESSGKKPDKRDVYTDFCGANFRSCTDDLHATEMLSLSSRRAVNNF